MNLAHNLFESPYLAFLKPDSSFAKLIGTQIVPVSKIHPMVFDDAPDCSAFRLCHWYLSTEQILALAHYLIEGEEQSDRSLAEAIKIVVHGFTIPAHHFQTKVLSNMGEQIHDWLEPGPLPEGF